MEATLYRQSLNGPVRWVATAAALGTLAALLPSAVQPGWGGTAVFLAVGLLWAALLSMHASILVAPEEVTVGVMGMSDTIPYAHVEAVEVGPSTGVREGVGVRFLKGANSTGYVVGGPTVRITTRTTDYLVSARNPEAAVADIRGRMGARR